AIPSTSHKPYHAEQVYNPGAETAEKSILRDAMLPLAVVDGLLAHVPAGPLHQRGQETVHGGEIGQVLEGPPPDQLEAATGVGRRILETEAPDAVGNARLRPFEA